MDRELTVRIEGGIYTRRAKCPQEKRGPILSLSPSLFKSAYNAIRRVNMAAHHRKLQKEKRLTRSHTTDVWARRHENSYAQVEGVNCRNLCDNIYNIIAPRNASSVQSRAVVCAERLCYKYM